MKRSIVLVLCVFTIVAVSLFASCGNKDNSSRDDSNSITSSTQSDLDSNEIGNSSNDESKDNTFTPVINGGNFETGNDYNQGGEKDD